MKKRPSVKEYVCRNKRASHRFELLEKIECGIVLVGSEVKTLRERNGSLEEAYARIDGGELWLIGFHIAAYKHAPSRSHEAIRPRKLLVHGRQLRKLDQKMRLKGFTLVPVDAFFSPRGHLKISLALARGKAQSDKRQDLKARDAKREMDRATRPR